MENIDNQYISNAIDNLFESVGIRDNVSQHDLLQLLYGKKINECIEHIAKFLGLSIRVNLFYISPNSKENFNSRDLVETDYRGRGIGGIVAQVSIPDNLPLYGSPGFKNFPISVRISNNCRDFPTTFIGIMAHELSHVVLRSLWHKEKENEIYTDLTAMLLGFSQIIKEGRKTKENDFNKIITTTYGYLSDSQFNYAFTKINRILSEQNDMKKQISDSISAYEKNEELYQKYLTRFKKFISYLDKNHNRRISYKDSQEIISFHQLGYIDNLQNFLIDRRNKIQQIEKVVSETNHYFQRTSNLLTSFNRDLYRLNSEIKNEIDKLKHNIEIVSKYVGFFYKFKMIVLNID